MTHGLEGRCSIQLSYRGISLFSILTVYQVFNDLSTTIYLFFTTHRRSKSSSEYNVPARDLLTPTDNTSFLLERKSKKIDSANCSAAL